MNRPALGS